MIKLLWVYCNAHTLVYSYILTKQQQIYNHTDDSLLERWCMHSTFKLSSNINDAQILVILVTSYKIIKIGSINYNHLLNTV